MRDHTFRARSRAPGHSGAVGAGRRRGARSGRGRRAGRLLDGHPGNGAAIATFGFGTLLAMKTLLTTAALVLVVVQVISALAMWAGCPG